MFRLVVYWPRPRGKKKDQRAVRPQISPLNLARLFWHGSPWCWGIMRYHQFLKQLSRLNNPYCPRTLIFAIRVCAFSRPQSEHKRVLDFLLEHPRRCFTWDTPVTRNVSHWLRVKQHSWYWLSGEAYVPCRAHFVVAACGCGAEHSGNCGRLGSGKEE